MKGWLKRILNFYKPCIIQFRDGTYEIREFRGIYLYTDLMDLLGYGRQHHTQSKYSRYFTDCKTHNLEDVLNAFSLLNTSHEEKKNNKKANNYSIILYRGEENEVTK